LGLAAILQEVDMPNILLGVIGTVLGLFGWFLLLMLNDKFDLMGDRKEK